MAQPVLAAQLFTVREFTKTAEGLAETFKKVKAIGYTAVQISAIGPIPPADVKNMLDEHGLTCCNTHIGWDRLQQDLPAVIAGHKLWHCQHVAVGSMPRPYREDGLAGYRRFAGEMNEVGRQLRDAGLSFSYHNHAFEFEHFDGRTALEIMYSDTDPQYVQAEIDVYWVQYGGGDPAAWIRKVPNRMPVIHLKDMTILNNQPTMAEVGEGNLNWPAILDACRAAGVQWYAVEQDICQRDPFESLAISYKNLTAMGLS
ncbi:MAG: sugar phosphate isomerase/epimerase family protein [Thermomicrobiales bacterium]